MKLLGYICGFIAYAVLMAVVAAIGTLYLFNLFGVIVE
jgi:hypothetical protein